MLVFCYLFLKLMLLFKNGVADGCETLSPRRFFIRAYIGGGSMVCTLFLYTNLLFC